MTRIPFIPREYQGLIMNHMFDVPRDAIFAGMGMGKTTSALTAIDAEFAAGVESKPALVLAPLRVAQNTWPDEAAKWEHLSELEVRPIVGTMLQRRDALRDRNANVFTINYENLPWLIETLDGRWPFGRVVGDESTKLKSFRLKQGGKRAQAIARVAHSQVSRWTNLTGTPAPNGLIDLWGQTWFLDAGQRLGRTFTSFEERWFRARRVSKDAHAVVREPTEFAQMQIEDRLRDICLSLDAADYFDIEKPIEVPIRVDLPKKARALYDEMEKRMYMELEGHEIEAFNAAAKSQKCLQLASGAVYVDQMATDDEHPRSREWIEVHDVKMQALEDIIEEAAGMPVLVAYHFRSTKARLLKHFPKGRMLDKNPQTIRDWNAGKIPILFAHPASAGHGLNLQDGGNIVAFIDHDWNFENFAQIIERIGPVRQFQAGHNRPVFIYYIIANDTTDESVMASRYSKESVQNILLAALKKRKVIL